MLQVEEKKKRQNMEDDGAVSMRTFRPFRYNALIRLTRLFTRLGWLKDSWKTSECHNWAAKVQGFESCSMNSPCLSKGRYHQAPHWLVISTDTAGKTTFHIMLPLQKKEIKKKEVIISHGLEFLFEVSLWSDQSSYAVLFILQLKRPNV